MINKTVSLVGQLQLKTNTYYICNRENIALDGVTYTNVVVSFGNRKLTGNLGNDEFQVGDMSITLATGEEISGGNYNFDPTDVWNNSKAVIKRYTGSEARFEDCEDYATGIIKNYGASNGILTLTIDLGDRRDDKLLPSLVTIRNS